MTSLADRLAYDLTRSRVATQATIPAATLADARALAEPADGSVLATAGRVATNDGGGGTWVWDSTSTDEDDGALTLAVSGVDNGRWKRVYTGPIDVRWFGATGDGTTDDTDAINNAISAASAAGGGTVYFPAGTYKVTVANGRALVVYSRITLRGDSKGQSAGARIVVYGAGAGIQANVTSGITRDVVVSDLTIDQNGSRPSGSIGVDLTGCSYSSVVRCSLRTHEKAIAGADGGGGAGYYNAVTDCEMASNSYGCYLGYSANAWRITGGRFYAQTMCGVYMTNCTGNFVHATFESNAVAVRFATGTSTSEARGYFEGNTSGAVIFDSGALRNVERAESLSNSGDYVRDDDGRNFSHSVHSPAQPATRTGYSSGVNLLINGDCEVDSNSDGMGDGWTMDPSVPAGTVLSLDGTVYKTGSKSQKYAVSATSARTLSRTVAVTNGQRYVFSGWARTDTAGVFRLVVGTTAVASTSYHFQTLGTAPSQTGAWEFFSVAFTSTASTFYFGIECLTPASTANAWIDGLKLEHGALPTEHGVDHLLSASKTLGAPLASGSTITPTHPIHKVSGTSTISTITAPSGFAGEIVLVPTGAWSTDTAGNIANAITATANQPVRAVYDPSAAKWYVR